MKFFTSQIAFKAASCFTLLAASITHVFSQGTTSPGYALTSCYHVLSPSSANPTLNVLNVGEFKFNYSNNPGAKPDFIRIRLFNRDGLFIGYDYDGIGISDHDFPTFRHPDYGQIVSVQRYDRFSQKWLVNSNVFTWTGEIGRVEISSLHWTGEEGNKTLDESTKKLQVNLVAPEDAFTLKSNDDDCFTFDNFNINYNHLLDGFCGNIVEPSIEVQPPAPFGSGWEQPYDEPIVFGKAINLRQPVGDDGKSWCDRDQDQQTIPWDFPKPVPSGCVNFNLKFKIAPCNTAAANCPDIDIVLPITICCDCDVRPVGPKK